MNSPELARSRVESWDYVDHGAMGKARVRIGELTAERREPAAGDGAS
ncbi:hypothetical protein OG474_10795 [Kribbella sp. NBC_01505]